MGGPVDLGRRRISGAWIAAICVILILGGLLGFVIAQVFANRFRTLEPFPLETYIGNYHALEGSRFKTVLRVENDLGYTAGVGRLMIFSIDGDGRAVAALVPARLADNNVFSRGQRYAAEVQVGAGGLIQVNSYVKN